MMVHSVPHGRQIPCCPSPRAGGPARVSVTTRLQRRHFTSTPPGPTRASRLPQPQRRSRARPSAAPSAGEGALPGPDRSGLRVKGASGTGGPPPWLEVLRLHPREPSVDVAELVRPQGVWRDRTRVSQRPLGRVQRRARPPGEGQPVARMAGERVLPARVRDVEDAPRSRHPSHRARRAGSAPDTTRERPRAARRSGRRGTGPARARGRGGSPRSSGSSTRVEAVDPRPPGIPSRAGRPPSG
jgi:hypothetical protein